jgi:hypothetical protein
MCKCLKDFTEGQLLKELLERNHYGSSAPKSIKFDSPYKEVVIGVDEEHTASIFIDHEAVQRLKEV